MHIRLAQPSDLPAIIDIYNEAIPSRMATGDTELIRVEDNLNWLEHHPANRPLWVVEDNGQVLGWLGLQDFYARCSYEATAEVSIYIATAHQHQGLATQLWRHLFLECPNLGINRLLALVFAHNLPSLQFFLKQGFQEWGHLPGIAKLDGIERSVKILGLHLVSAPTLPLP